MLIDIKIYEYIVPDSALNTDAESYEYYLIWQGVDGGFYSWLFEDFIKRQEVNSDTINTKSENITNVFSSAKKYVELTAEDLTQNEFDVLSNILRAKYIRRYFKDGTYMNVVIKSNSSTKRQSDFNYTFTIQIEEIENNILK